MSSSSSLQPIKVWGQHGPNPPKVAMILEELSVPHSIVDIPISDAKNPEYVAVNPNGRIPAIQDPNTGITLWESGAILEYLVEHYDTQHQLSFPAGTAEAAHAKQWLYFQTSGQGPYYGQAAWFKRYHPEKVPSAVERYVKEINRVTGVLEGVLAKQKEEFAGKGGDGPWLVGNKLSFADIAFVPWQALTPKLMEKDEFNEDDYPLVKEWIGKMASRPKVKKVLDVAFKPLNTPK